MTAEDEQVQVELPGTPALAFAASEGALQALERDQERQRPGLGVRAGGDVEGDDRVAELGLVQDPDGSGGIQPRHADQARAVERGQGVDPGGERAGGVAEVRSQADVGAHPSSAWSRRTLVRVERARESSCPENTRVGDVTVLVLHPPLAAGAGPLTAALDAARRALAVRHRAGFLGAGAVVVAIVEEARDEPFGARLRRLAGSIATPGLVVLGSGALALARAADYRAFVEAAASDDLQALANNRFSADAVAVSRAAILRDLPDLPSDNALPRWLDEVAGCPVADLRGRTRLAIDLDSPADVVIAGRAVPAAVADSPFPRTLAAMQSVMTDRRLELTVAGRTSAGTLAALERRAACRVRAIVEERGLRAASRLAQAPSQPAGSVGSTAQAGSPGWAARPPGRCLTHTTQPTPPGTPLRSWGSCSSGTARRRSAGSWPAWATAPSSTRGCCWPTASAPTRPRGRSPRIASRPTSCFPTRSAIRGCGR